MESLLVPLCAIAILIGLAGMVVPVLPGLLLVYGAVVVWAVFADAGWAKWLVVGVATFWVVVGTVVKYAWPGRRMKQAGVPNLSMLAGLGLSIAGFFLIPVVGLPVGFVAGIWLAEWIRIGDPRKAWPSTVHALKAAGLAMLIELAAGVLIALTWVAGVALA